MGLTLTKKGGEIVVDLEELASRKKKSPVTQMQEWSCCMFEKCKEARGSQEGRVLDSVAFGLFFTAMKWTLQDARRQMSVPGFHSPFITDSLKFLVLPGHGRTASSPLIEGRIVQLSPRTGGAHGILRCGGGDVHPGIGGLVRNHGQTPGAISRTPLWFFFDIKLRSHEDKQLSNTLFILLIDKISLIFCFNTKSQPDGV